MKSLDTGFRSGIHAHSVAVRVDTVTHATDRQRTKRATAAANAEHAEHTAVAETAHAVAGGWRRQCDEVGGADQHRTGGARVRANGCGCAA